LLNQDLKRLSDAYLSLLHHIEEVGDIGPERGMLGIRYAEVQNTWSRVFAPAVRAARHDRAALVNRLLPPRVARQLSSGVNNKVRAALGELIVLLRQFRPNDAPASLGMETLLDGPLGEPLTVFRYTIPDDPYAMLSETRPGIEVPEEFSLDPVRHIRVAVHVRHLTSGAIFAFDLWAANPGGDDEPPHDWQLTLTWLHALDEERVFRKTASFLKGMASYESLPDACRFAFFCPDSVFEGEAAFSALRSVLYDAQSRLNGLDFYKLSAGSCDVSADLRPYGGVEMQLSVAFAWDVWGEVSARAVAQLIRETTAYKIETETLTGMIEDMTSRLRPVTQPNTLEVAYA
jgi:hypothetical protein